MALLCVYVINHSSSYNNSPPYSLVIITLVLLLCMFWVTFHVFLVLCRVFLLSNVKVPTYTSPLLMFTDVSCYYCAVFTMCRVVYWHYCS